MKKTSFKQGMMTNNISLQNTTCCAQSEGRDAKGATTIEANPAPPQPDQSRFNPLTHATTSEHCYPVLVWDFHCGVGLSDVFHVLCLGSAFSKHRASTNLVRICEDCGMGVSALCNSFGDLCAYDRAKHMILLIHLMLLGMN